MGNRTHCETYNTDGSKTIKPKLKYNTLAVAKLEAKKFNARPNQTEMVVAYKCTVCHKYHLGRNGKLVTPTLKARIRKQLEVLEFKKKMAMPSFKIVGKIDLSKFGYKSKLKKKK